MALVHQMPYCCYRPGKSSVLDKVYFGTIHMRNYIHFHLLRLNLVMGMSCLVRKSVLDEFGGLVYFGKYIAEDLMMAKAIHKKYTYFLKNYFLLEIMLNYRLI